MRIRVREDVAAPVGRVWAAAADAAGWEGRARRRGAEVRRLDGGALGPGSAWRVAFRRRGRPRVAVSEVTRFDPPAAAGARLEGGGFAVEALAEFAPLGDGGTRVVLTLDLRARTLPARLVLQPLRLARGVARARAQARLAAWARGVEARWRDGR